MFNKKIYEDKMSKTFEKFLKDLRSTLSTPEEQMQICWI